MSGNQKDFDIPRISREQREIIYQESKAHLEDLKKIKSSVYTIDDAIKAYEWEIAEHRKYLFPKQDDRPAAGLRTIVAGPGDYSNTSSTPDRGEF